MATKRTRPTRPKESPYEKVSATLERPVLREIREKSANVSEFLNEAAKDKLYFERVREGIKELRRQGVREDPEFRRRLEEALDEADAWRRERSRAPQ